MRKATANGDSHEGTSRGHTSGLKRPTTPTSSLPLAITRPSPQSLPRLANPSSGSASATSSPGTSSPASSPGVQRTSQLGSPGTARGAGTHVGHTPVAQGGSLSLAASPKEANKNAKKLSAPSRIAMQVRKPESPNAVTADPGTPPSVSKATGLKSPLARSRLSSPPSTSAGDAHQMKELRKTHTIAAANSQLRRPSEPVVSTSDVNTSGSWSGRAASEAPVDHRLRMMSRSSSNLAQRVASGSSDSGSSAISAGAVPKGVPGGLSPSEKGTKMTAPSNIAAPNTRRRNLSEGSTAKHSILLRKEPEPAPSTSGDQSPGGGKEAVSEATAMHTQGLAPAECTYDSVCLILRSLLCLYCSLDVSANV